MSLNIFAQRWRGWLVIGPAGILALALGVFISAVQLDFFLVLLILLGFAGLVIVVSGSYGIRIGYLVMVLSLVLGYRTLDFGDLQHIHPAEVLVWVLSGMLVAERILSRQSFKFWLPAWLWLLIPFWIWGLWLGVRSGYSLSNLLIELRVFLLLIPLFFITEYVLATPRYWRYVLGGLVLASFFIAAVGLVEVLFPQFENQQFGYISNVQALVTSEGFARAPFSFWGTQDAIFGCVLGMPFLLFFWHIYPRTSVRVLCLAIMIVALSALYFSGHRDAWFFFAIQVTALPVLLRRPIWILAIAAVLVLFIWVSPRIFPESAQQRVMTLVLAAQGQESIGDTSTQKRVRRASNAVTAIITRPQGSGWTSAGWVHSDFLQFAVNLGIVPGLVFLFGYCAALFYLVRESWRAPPLSREHILSVALVLAFVAAGGMLAVDATIVLIQLALPVWLIWVMVECWLRLDPEIKKLI